MRTETLARIVCVATCLVLPSDALAQAPRPMLIAIPAPDGPAPAGFDPQLLAILKQVGFLPDGRGAFLTCETPARAVLSGAIPPDNVDELRNKLRGFVGLRLYDNPFVAPLYENFCAIPQDHGESQARQAAGLTTAGLAHGKGVVVAITDQGIDMRPISARFPHVTRNTTFSYPQAQTTILGKHGTLCAYAAAMAAPAIEVADVRIQGDARSFAEAYTRLRMQWEKEKGNWKALVVSTSWEFPQGIDGVNRVFRAEESLASEPSHPLRTALRCLVESGVDVVFAAGNGGACEPASSRAPGTITPPNALPEVLTIAGVDATKARLSDSGQGGSTTPTKPDLSAFGSIILHNGSRARHTSVATAFAAGMTASLRSLDGWSAAERPTSLVRRCFAEHADRNVQIANGSGTIASQLRTHSMDFGQGVMRFDEQVLSWKDDCGKLGTTP